MDGSSLHVNVCDPCIDEARAKGRVREMPPSRPLPVIDTEEDEFADARVVEDWGSALPNTKPET
jgi:hypothetical protein